MWNSKDLTIAECRYTETSVYVDGINYRLKSLAKWSNQVTSSSFYLCHLSTACIVYTHKWLNLTHPTIISTGHEHLHIITISTHHLYRAYPIPAISHFTILPFHSSSKPRLRLFINRYGENMVENDSKVGSSSNLSVKPNSKGGLHKLQQSTTTQRHAKQCCPLMKQQHPLSQLVPHLNSA